LKSKTVENDLKKMGVNRLEKYSLEIDSEEGQGPAWTVVPTKKRRTEREL
jgi:hypothetical protein